MQEVKGNDLIAVWFSCGAASAVAAKRTVERYGKERVRVLNTPIAEEHEDNRRFLKDVEQWVGVDIESVVNSKWPESSCKPVWDWKGFMSRPIFAPCTYYLKKGARYEWQDKHKPDWHVLGFTADEKRRSDKFLQSELSNMIPVLVEDGITKQGCMDILARAGVRPPEMYRLGYPNANCIGCVRATSPTYWNKVRETHPEVFADRAEQSRRLGTRLVRVKGERIFLDELDPEARGRPLKTLTLECGAFCEEL